MSIISNLGQTNPVLRSEGSPIHKAQQQRDGQVGRLMPLRFFLSPSLTPKGEEIHFATSLVTAC